MVPLLSVCLLAGVLSTVVSSTIHDFTKEVTVMVPVIIAKTIFEETHYKVLLIFVTAMVPVIIAKTIC